MQLTAKKRQKKKPPEKTQPRFEEKNKFNLSLKSISSVDNLRKTDAKKKQSLESKAARDIIGISLQLFRVIFPNKQLCELIIIGLNRMESGKVVCSWYIHIIVV